VAHTCNYKYSGSRDQEDHGSKPAQVTVHEPLSQKNPSQKRADDVAPSSEFKPQYHKKQTNKSPISYITSFLCSKFSNIFPSC
jgi:hypothetical protein